MTLHFTPPDPSQATPVEEPRRPLPMGSARMETAELLDRLERSIGPNNGAQTPSTLELDASMHAPGPDALELGSADRLPPPLQPLTYTRRGGFLWLSKRTVTLGVQPTGWIAKEDARDAQPPSSPDR